MRALASLALVSLLAAAGVDPAPDSILRIREEGAKKLLELADADVEAVAKSREAGAATEDDERAARRRRLDAEVELLEIRMAHKDAADDLPRKRRDLLFAIEQIEARRFAEAQKRAGAGACGFPELVERRLAHQFAWIERNHADEALLGNANASLLELERTRQRAKASMLARRDLLEDVRKRHGAGSADAAALRAARRASIRAETDLAVAEERVRLAREAAK